MKFLNIGREKGEVLGWGGLAPSGFGDPEKSESEIEQETEAYWSKLDATDYVKKVKMDIESKGIKKALIVDDCSWSGYSSSIAFEFLKHYFSDLKLRYHAFLEKTDKDVFNNEDWIGIHLPWNSDKSYTLLAEHDNSPEKVVAEAETDPVRRAKGIALKEEIKEMFR